MCSIAGACCAVSRSTSRRGSLGSIRHPFGDAESGLRRTHRVVSHSGIGRLLFFIRNDGSRLDPDVFRSAVPYPARFGFIRLFSVPASISSRRCLKSASRSKQLQNVVGQADELPLRVDVFQTTETEASKMTAFFDLTKHRLHNRLAHFVNGAPRIGLKFLIHGAVQRRRRSESIFEVHATLKRALALPNLTGLRLDPGSIRHTASRECCSTAECLPALQGCRRAISDSSRFVL